jgi:hypothetical protein
MKNLIVIFLFLTSGILNSLAQPNSSFENWSTVYGSENPDNWQTLNFLSMFTNPISSFKATGVDKHSGNYALKLKTIYLNNNPLPGTIDDTIGYFFTGKISISPPSLKLGIPYVGRPQKLEFWAKYLPVGTDLAGASVILQRWNGIKTDTISTGSVIIDTTENYTFFQIDLTYNSPELSDTLIIGFSSSYKRILARVGSTIYVDDVALTGWVGIDEQNKYADIVKIFPNPATDIVNILAKTDEADNVQITDISGKDMGLYKFQNYNVNINIGLFAEGIYLYEIRNKKNNPLNKGKFNVVK